MRTLKERWTVEALAAADRAFMKMDPVAAYQGKPPLHPFVSPFGEHEGRADFRYLPLGVIPAYRRIERADLTGSTDARNGQLCCSLVDCVLDRSSMETNLGDKTVQNCTFVRSKFTHTSLRGEFVECNFSHCSLSYARSAQAKFVRCRFAGANFVGSGFDYCVFDDCSWESARVGNAAFPHCRFIDRWPTPEQFADAMIPGARFERAPSSTP
jgi:uncharacterized protein YjbI with pentapeptide repeats